MRHVGQTSPHRDARYRSSRAVERRHLLPGRFPALLVIAGTFCKVSVRTARSIEKRIAEANHRPCCGAGLTYTAERLQGRDGGQDRDGVLPGEPGDLTMVARSRRFGDEHLEGQLR